MEELQNLIAHLKNQGLTETKIPVDVWCGIIEYFANKQETKQTNTPDVSQQRELLITYEIEASKPYNASEEMVKPKVDRIMKAINCC